MLPAAYVALDALPLTPNGKLDRRALPAPRFERGALETQYVAPRTPLEAQLAGIWAAVLDIEQVGVYDNFFDLGGHSLKAVQVLSRVQDAFHTEVSLHSLFRAPTIAAFAGAIEGAARVSAEPPAIRPLARQAHRLDPSRLDRLAEASREDAVELIYDSSYYGDEPAV
jgi:acyl carrier protein